MLAVAGAVGLFWQSFPVWWVVPLVALLLVAVVRHEKTLQAKESARRATVFYEESLDRVEGRWQEPTLRCSIRVDEAHPFAWDLDLFGERSLFSLLCTAHTAAGQQVLAQWLCNPASKQEVLARQEAIEELRGRVDLRERMASVAVGRADAGQMADLAQWAAARSSLNRSLVRSVAVLAGLALSGTFLTSLTLNTTGSVIAFVVALTAAAAAGLVFRGRIVAILAEANRHRGEALSLAEIFKQTRNEKLESGRFRHLRIHIQSSAAPPIRTLDKLERLLVMNDLKKLELPAVLWFLLTSNILLAPFSFLFWSTHLALAVERWRVEHGEELAQWIEVAGELDALCALAGYAYDHPDHPFPEIEEKGSVFDGEDLRHPLMVGQCVPNSIDLMAPGSQLLIVSGSNMSGKSTLLRTVGTNAVLAFAGAPVCASRLRLSPLTIGATLRLRDSIQHGESRFLAEIQRVSRLADRARSGENVLFLFDEFLSGTNSHDRASAAWEILRCFVDCGALGLITTHDLALTHVPDGLASRAANVHFRDDFREGRLVFDHRMYPGRVEQGNALALIAALGFQGTSSNVKGAADKPIR